MTRHLDRIIKIANELKNTTLDKDSQFELLEELADRVHILYDKSGFTDFLKSLREKEQIRKFDSNLFR